MLTEFSWKKIESKVTDLGEFALPCVQDEGGLLLTPVQVVDTVRLRPVLEHFLLAHQLQDRLQCFRSAPQKKNNELICIFELFKNKEETYLTMCPVLFFFVPPTTRSSGQCMNFVANP